VPTEQKIAVVIPAYRVADRICAVLDAIPACVARVFVVDDGSPDDLSGRLAKYGEPRFTLLRHQENRGVGGATVTGILAALAEQCEIVVKVDGDGQMDPAEIPNLVKPLLSGSADHSKACRFRHPSALKTMPKLRLVGNIVLTFLTKLVSGYWNVVDPVNGYFATRSEVLSRLALGTISPRYFFETDLLIRLNILEARVAEVAIPARYGDEPSSLSIARALFSFPPRLLAGLIRRVFWRYLVFDVSPVAAFLIGGLLLFGFGTIFGLYHWVLSAGSGIVTPTGTVMLAVLPLILGFQLLLQGLVLDISNTPKPTAPAPKIPPDS